MYLRTRLWTKGGYNHRKVASTFATVDNMCTFINRWNWISKWNCVANVVTTDRSLMVTTFTVGVLHQRREASVRDSGHVGLRNADGQNVRFNDERNIVCPNEQSTVASGTTSGAGTLHACLQYIITGSDTHAVYTPFPSTSAAR